MITLPSQARRALLTSFWLVVSVTVGLIAGASLWLFARRSGLLVGVGVACAWGLTGRLWPRLVSAVYRAWNRAARLVARGGRSALLWICYFVVMLVVGKSGGRFGPRGSTSHGSLWMSRGTLPPAAYPGQFNAPTDGVTVDGWVRGYLHWAANSKNLWAIALLPFLALIAVLEEQEQPVLPATIYTLF